MNLLDTTRTWIVDGNTGDNANAGHPDTYPIVLSGKAKETLGGALSGAASGDEIIFWPGTYDESLDFTSGSKSISLVGRSKKTCIINPTSGIEAIGLENGCSLKNLSVIGNAVANATTVFGQTKGVIRIKNCYLECNGTSGTIDSLFIGGGGTDVIVEDTEMLSPFDALNSGGKTLGIYNRCTFRTNGNLLTAIVRSVVAGSNARLIFNNCIFIANRTGASSYRASCVEGSGYITFNNCVFICSTSSSATGDAIALYANIIGAYAYFVANNCTFYSSSNGGDELDVKAAAGCIVILNNCIYDKDKVDGDVRSALGIGGIAEMSQGAPPSNPSVEDVLNYLYRAFRNKVTNDGDETVVFDDAGSVELFKADTIKATNLFTKEEYTSG